MTSPSKETSLAYLRQTIRLAKKSPPKPTNFRVGCLVVSFDSDSSPTGKVISTGYTLELPGNTHAEQCALSKLASSHSVTEVELGSVFQPNLNAVLYTSLEPCGKRLSGNLACVQRIIATRYGNPDGGIRKVVFGAKEPGTFVQDSQSCKLLTGAGIEWEYLPDFEQEILQVAMEGHIKDNEASQSQNQSATPANVAAEQSSKPAVVVSQPSDDTESVPRNPKKRMMEAPPGSEESRT